MHDEYFRKATKVRKRSETEIEREREEASLKISILKNFIHASKMFQQQEWIVE